MTEHSKILSQHLDRAAWYQLLDLASHAGALISDASGVYDPRHYDDRLLLGLKGTFSEAQWYLMRTHLYAALLNKARRGELAIRLPIGYDRLPNGQVVLTPDSQVQSAIRLVFEQFESTGTARGEIVWMKPDYSTIYAMLKHPAYVSTTAGGGTFNRQPSGSPAEINPYEVRYVTHLGVWYMV